MGDTKKDILNNTMEAKSLALKHNDSKKQSKVRSIRGNSYMADSREESMSDNDDSSIMMDDS